MVFVSPEDGPLQGDTLGESFHTLTVIEGAARVSCGGESIDLRPFETAFAAGEAGAYKVEATSGPATLLRSAVPN